MEKTYINHLNNLDVEAGGLLGFFDADGQYIIDDDIKQELIKCNKLITDYKNNIISATAQVAEFLLKFNVYIQEGEGNQKRAGLFVDENSKLGFAKSELQTYVDSVVLPNTGAFFDEIKKRFNLFLRDESEGVDMNNNNLTKIINKKSSGVKKYKTMVPVLIDLDKAYVVKMLSILKHSGEYGQTILSELTKQVDDKKINKKDQAYWRQLKVMVDKLLIPNEGVFSTMVQEQIRKAQLEYLRGYFSTKEPVAKAPTPKAEKKKEKKKGGFEGLGQLKYSTISSKPVPPVPKKETPVAKVEIATTTTISGNKIEKKTEVKITTKETKTTGSEIFGSKITNIVTKNKKQKKEITMDR